MVPRRKATYFVLCLLTVGGCVLSVVYGSKFTGGVYLICLALLLVLYRVQLNRAVKLNYIRISETGASSFSYTTSFEQDSVKTINHTTGAVTEIKYGDIARIEKTEHLMLLFAKTGQFLLVFKNQLGEGKAQELLDFLKEHIKEAHK